MTYRYQYSDALIFDKFGTTTGTSSTGVQFGDNPCGAVRFKAHPNNIGIFMLGEAGSELTSYPLDAGDDTGWVATSNLSRYLHSNISGATDQLLWWLQK